MLFEIRYTLSGGFGGCENKEWETIEADNLEEANKRAELFYEGSDGDIPTIAISYNKDTIYINKRCKSDITEISFPEFKGYTILCSQIVKYTLTIIFAKYLGE